MVFSSILFLCQFLPATLVLYFLSPKKMRNAVLFFISLIFYAWGEPIYISLMIFSTVVDYTHGRLVDKYLNRGNRKKARNAVISSIIINLGLLCFFKYMKMVSLPVGISFYTFQTMSYTIDIYRRDAKVQKNIIDFGAYVSMFPQLIAGPIVQYKTIANELKERKESVELFADGVRLFLCGLGKKVLFANNIGLLWEQIKNMAVEELSIATAWIGIIAFAFQIYYDFSGYSDMARGLGKMLGFHFPINFNYPYAARSITDFWRRWHITLGAWFRDYVYIPLGGSKKGLLIQIRNIAIVWLLTGIWHGASWNFLLWGVYYGILLIFEKSVLLKILHRLPAVVGHVYTILCVLIGWAFFAFDKIGEGTAYIQAMLGMYKNSIIDREAGFLIINYGLLFILLGIGSIDVLKKIKIAERYNGLVCVFENIAAILLFMAVMSYLVDASYNPFLYFRF